ncbi:hypothetical protein GJAV_G00136950 [Gymnothorax javanicus]|nr:hypothetical protein GJAV_G00136950 [Gymnothorax javanicus]
MRKTYAECVRLGISDCEWTNYQEKTPLTANGGARRQGRGGIAPLIDPLTPGLLAFLPFLQGTSQRVIHRSSESFAHNSEQCVPAVTCRC